MKSTKILAQPVRDESRYRLLVEAVKDYAIYMLDPSGIVTSWNPGAQLFKGYVADEIIGQHFSRFYTAEDQATGLPTRALRTSLTEGKFEAEGWRVRKDGTKFWAYVVIDPIISEAGEHLGFAKVTRDLTERKQVQDALWQSQEQFRLLVQGVTDYAIFMLDPDGRINSWNAGAQRIKGYTPDEIIGEHFSRFYTQEDRDAEEPDKALDTARREGRFEREGWRIRKNGAPFWAHVIIDQIKDDSGSLIGFAKITRDVTERREAAAALESAREALFQSQKLEAIGKLTGGVAHDFNNLLMAIMGSMDLLRKYLPDDPRARRLLDNALQGAERGATMTKRMLAFARRQELKPEIIDVQLLILGMKDLMARTLGPTVSIETRFINDSNFIRADANELEMAILNLAVNARDAISGGGQIVISVKKIDAPQPSDALKAALYACISVADNGSGMDPRTLERATEPFFTTKGIGKGTGLGLSMVHGLAEQSGGRFILRSTLGQGTTAELWFPAVTAQEQTLSEQSKAKSHTRQRALAILVVDDDPLVLMSTVALIEDLGHTVIEASSGSAALNALKQNPAIELLITDQAMPNMSGLQLAQAIRKQRPTLPIILASGFAEAGDDSSSTFPRLAKPYSQADLQEIIGFVSGDL